MFHLKCIPRTLPGISRLYIARRARSGQILITEEIFSRVEEIAKVKDFGELTLNGFPKLAEVLQMIEIENV